jgi:class 3 adenylate cyclase
MTGFGPTPWTIGVYFRNEDVNAELRRLIFAGSAGLFVLILAVAMAWQLSRYLARPLNGLARAARQVRDFELDDVRALPRSRVLEIDAAGSAVNAMVGSLRWFELYVPRTLVQRLIRQGDVGIGASAQRVVTVLFTDVVGFTSLSETMSAQDAAELLNEHFRLLGQCVEAEDGTIDKFLGDGLMAFWGAPEEQADHTERACRAALAMRAAVDADNASRAAKGLPPLQVRIGLHAGAVIVGNIGAPGRINYTIVGDTVNTASRLEQLGRHHPYDNSDVTILLSAEVRTRAPSASAARSLGSQHLSGRRGEVEVFAL